MNQSTEGKFVDMVAALAKDGQEIVSDLTPASAHILHMSAGLAGETSELGQAIALHLLEGQTLDIGNVVEEIGDCEFYMEGLRRGMGISRERVTLRMAELPPSRSRACAGPTGHIMWTTFLLMTHAGDVLDFAKKHSIMAKALDVDGMITSLAWVELKLQSLRDALHILRVASLDANIEKLLTGEKARYKLGMYTNAQAVARADKQ